MDVAVDQAGDAVTAAALDDERGLVFLEADDDPVPHRDMGGMDLAGQDIDQPDVTHQQVDGLLAASGLLGLEVQVAALGPGFLAAVAAGVTLVTASGSAFHAVRLARDGPDAVAAMVGGVRVERTSADPGERRLVNVVQEMAIASGIGGSATASWSAAASSRATRR